MALSKTIKSIKKAETQIVTPKIEAFLRKYPEGAVWDDDGYELFKQITKATFGSNSDRSGRFGASSRGKCMRAQMWTYMGMPSRKVIDTDVLNLFNDGKWRHMRWQMMLMQSGAATHVEYPLRWDKYRLTSSVDALNSHERWLFELKGDRNMSRLLDTAGGVPFDHMRQIHTMLWMTGWDKAIYVMEDKSTQQWREKTVIRDPAIISEVRIELEILNEHVEDRSIPEPLAACKNREGPYKTCPFAKPCIDRWKAGNDYWPGEAGNWES